MTESKPRKRIDLTIDQLNDILSRIEPVGDGSITVTGLEAVAMVREILSWRSGIRPDSPSLTIDERSLVTEVCNELELRAARIERDGATWNHHAKDEHAKSCAIRKLLDWYDNR